MICLYAPVCAGTRHAAPLSSQIVWLLSCRCFRCSSLCTRGDHSVAVALLAPSKSELGRGQVVLLSELDVLLRGLHRHRHASDRDSLGQHVRVNARIHTRLYIMLYPIILYSTLLYSTILYSTLLYYTNGTARKLGHSHALAHGPERRADGSVLGRALR